MNNIVSELVKLIESPWMQVSQALMVSWMLVVTKFAALRFRSKKTTSNPYRSARAAIITATISSCALGLLVEFLEDGHATYIWFFATLAIVNVPAFLWFEYLERKLEQRNRSAVR